MLVALCQRRAAERFISIADSAEKLSRADFILRHATAQAVHRTKIHARPQVTPVTTLLIELRRAWLILRHTKPARVNDPQVIAAASVVPVAGTFQQPSSLVFVFPDSLPLEVINSQGRPACALSLFPFPP